MGTEVLLLPGTRPCHYLSGQYGGGLRRRVAKYGEKSAVRGRDICELLKNEGELSAHRINTYMDRGGVSYCHDT